eukprot:12891762-Prorocentrum_lima.AAC.1
MEVFMGRPRIQDFWVNNRLSNGRIGASRSREKDLHSSPRLHLLQLDTHHAKGHQGPQGQELPFSKANRHK